MSTSSGNSGSNRPKKKYTTENPQGIPAPYIFYATSVIWFMGLLIAYKVRGTSMLFLPGITTIILLVALFINESSGFLKLHEMPRARTPRHKFTGAELLLMYVYISLNIIISLYIFLTR